MTKEGEQALEDKRSRLDAVVRRGRTGKAKEKIGGVLKFLADKGVMLCFHI